MLRYWTLRSCCQTGCGGAPDPFVLGCDPAARKHEAAAARPLFNALALLARHVPALKAAGGPATRWGAGDPMGSRRCAGEVDSE